jgi:Domain of unknown function (DUF1707)
VNGAAGRDYPPGELRVSDADRDRAVTELGEHFQAGRITAEELDERSGLALQAKTGNDLTELLADLPAGQSSRTGMTPVPGGTAQLPGGGAPLSHRHAPVAAIVSAFLVMVAVIGVLGSWHSHDHYWAGLMPLLLAVLILRRLVGGVRGRRM